MTEFHIEGFIKSTGKWRPLGNPTKTFAVVAMELLANKQHPHEGLRITNGTETILECTEENFMLPVADKFHHLLRQSVCEA
jgi:hypothetical protein